MAKIRLFYYLMRTKCDYTVLISLCLCYFLQKYDYSGKKILTAFFVIFALKVIVFSEYPIVGSDSDTFIVSFHVKILPKVIA